MSVLSLKHPVTWEDFEKVAAKFGLNLDMNKLYEDFSILREAQEQLTSLSDRVDQRWTEFFRRGKETTCGKEEIRFCTIAQGTRCYHGDT